MFRRYCVVYLFYFLEFHKAVDSIVKKGELDMEKDILDAPANHLWGLFASDKWDHEYSRNALLNFIDEKGLTDEVVKWIEERVECRG